MHLLDFALGFFSSVNVILSLLLTTIWMLMILWDSSRFFSAGKGIMSIPYLMTRTSSAS